MSVLCMCLWGAGGGGQERASEIDEDHRVFAVPTAPPKSTFFILPTCGLSPIPPITRTHRGVKLEQGVSVVNG